jgi:beta-glucosidase
MSTWDRHASAILECWLSGQAAGSAVADLLLGVANPSGRLAETLPRRLQDNPSYLNFPGEAGHVRYGEGVFVGYRGYDKADLDVSYPFGHGLSYTTFSYTDLHITVAGSVATGDLSITITCMITNAGDRRGQEVIQLYVSDPVAAVARPIRELKGFVKLDLEPGESATAKFQLSAKDLSYWSVTDHSWCLEPGRFDIAVGASSRDLRLVSTLDIPGPTPPTRLDAMATLQEWLAEPNGAALMREAIGTDIHGRALGILGDPERMKVLGNFPIGSLATFPGIGLDQDAVSRLVGLYESGHPRSTE